MSIFKGDATWLPFTLITPVGYAVLGFLAGYFFNNATVFVATGILLALFVVAGIDCSGREIDRLLNWSAMFCFLVGLVALWVTTISVNHWWLYLIPRSILR